MLFFASICVIAFTIFLCKIPREKLPYIVNQLIIDAEYSVLANKEIIKDWVNAKRNRKVTASQNGRVAIVTGGSRGIGLEIVRMFLELDMHVIIACRNTSAGDEAILKIRQSGIMQGTAKVYTLDNSSMKSVKNFVQTIKREFQAVHVLVNNAGIMFTPYKETEDGIEQQWAVNYLSHFLLSSLLLPLLHAGGTPSKKSRIINVSSCAHRLGMIDFDRIKYKNQFFPQLAYAQSKLAQVLFTKKLQCMLVERGYNVEIFAVHPGIVYTDIFVHSFVWRYRCLTYYMFKTPEQGATSIVHTAVSEEVEGRGGGYFSNCLEEEIDATLCNATSQDKLYQLSLQQAKLDSFFPQES